jgi:hypothetical protein
VRFLWILIAVTAVALAVACFNLATLLLARAEARRREIATRRAVGATSFGLFQQLALENLLLAGCSCVLSLPVAFAVTQWMRGVPVIRGLQISMDTSLDPRALAFAMLVGLASGLGATCFSLMPLRAGFRRRAPWRNTLVAAQAACAMAVLAPAGLLARSMHELRATPLGFDPRGVLLASLDLSSVTQRTTQPGAAELLEPGDGRRPAPGAVRSSANTPREEADRIVRDLLREARAQAPEAAITTDNVMPTVMRTTLDVLPASEAASGRWRQISFARISDGYFELLRIPALGGRTILPSDDRNSRPVAVVSESAAKLLGRARIRWDAFCGFAASRPSARSWAW